MSLDNVTLREWTDILPLPEKIQDVSLRPGKRDGKPTDVKFALTMTKIRNMDMELSSVGVRMFVALTWHTPLANYRIDESQLWTPKLSFLNDDSLVISAPPPTFYPHTGMVRQIVTIDGCISQDFDLRIFPWDVSHVSFLIVANLNETGTVRLFWDERRDIVKATPKYINERLTEWFQMEEMNSLHRLPYSKHNRLYGKYNGVQFTIVLTRNMWYYMVKILSIVVMLNIISWGVFRMREDPVMYTVTITPSNSSSGRGGGGNRRLYETNYGQESSEETFFRPPDIYMGAERYSERLSFIAAILLACVGFQYMIGESIPKLGILTTMDWLLMSSYITLFAMSIESFAVHYYSLNGSQYGRSMDLIGSYLVPIFYLLMQSYHILTAVCKRKKHLVKWRGQAGVSLNMLRSNIISAERIKNYKKESDEILGGRRQSGIEGPAPIVFHEEDIAQTNQMREEQLELQSVGELCFNLTKFGDNDMVDLVNGDTSKTSPQASNKVGPQLSPKCGKYTVTDNVVIPSIGGPIIPSGNKSLTEPVHV